MARFRVLWLLTPFVHGDGTGDQFAVNPPLPLPALLTSPLAHHGPASHSSITFGARPHHTPLAAPHHPHSGFVDTSVAPPAVAVVHGDGTGDQFAVNSPLPLPALLTSPVAHPAPFPGPASHSFTTFGGRPHHTPLAAPHHPHSGFVDTSVAPPAVAVVDLRSGGAEASKSGEGGGSCTIAYELACANGQTGPVNSLLDCPAGEEEVCLDVVETECTTTNKEECRTYDETECQLQQKEICIKADATTCLDTVFTPSRTVCSGSGLRQQCRSVETQKCGEPQPEQVCADISQVICKPESFEICQSIVSVKVKDECIQFHEPDCRETTDQICYQGYGAGDCHVSQEQECKYITRPCTGGGTPAQGYSASGYGCQHKKEKVCNYVSRTKCAGGGASQQCKTLTSQKCTLKLNTRCIKVPTVVAEEKCKTVTVSSCSEVPSQECLTVYKTECDRPERQDVCFDIPEGGCTTDDQPPLTNRVCEGQQKDICFKTDRTVCSKSEKEHCFTIPTTTCGKVLAKKCFRVATPPLLVQVPKAHCGGGGGGAAGRSGGGGGYEGGVGYVPVNVPHGHTVLPY